MGNKYIATNPRFIPDPVAVAHASRAWSLLLEGFDRDDPAPIEQDMTPAQAARFHLQQAIERLDQPETRAHRQPRRPTLAEIAVAEDRPPKVA
jgi:hypothetical protein